MLFYHKYFEGILVNYNQERDDKITEELVLENIEIQKRAIEERIDKSDEDLRKWTEKFARIKKNARQSVKRKADREILAIRISTVGLLLISVRILVNVLSIDLYNNIGTLMTIFMGVLAIGSFEFRILWNFLQKKREDMLYEDLRKVFEV